MKVITIQPIKETTEDYERLEKKIIALLRKEIYVPILKELGEPKQTLKNSSDDSYDNLIGGIKSGRITFNQGIFSGRFNSGISKELRDLGARWDRKTGTWKISQSLLPIEVRNTISGSEYKFKEKLASIDRKLAQILPEEIADRLKVADIFDSSLWKTERSLRATLKDISVAPQLSEIGRKRIADQWQNNMRLWIKDFTQAEIVKLRKEIQTSVFTGNRYGSAVKTIQESYGVSQNKAKFLARQETSLLMTTFKETRYKEAGVMEYKWHSVVGSKNHPVRPAHKALADASKSGKIFKWDDPPITTAPGEPVRRNNPGQDYNCRCFAVPIVRFK